MTTTVSRLDLGKYETARAAALSGVPERTVYHWAQIDLLRPSVSRDRPMLWSYADLLTIRLVRWLRLDKPGLDVARTRMREVRAMLDEVGDELWTTGEQGQDVPTVKVTSSGRIIVVRDSGSRTVDGQYALEDTLDLFAPFQSGVDLRRPRPRLRIHPGRVSGEPHLAGSRLTSLAVASLSTRGMDLDQIAQLYPHEDRDALAEAIDLERQLARSA